MKDMPALLLRGAVASATRRCWIAVFDRVIDNAQMLRNFVQIMRSGVVGRKSLGSRPKRLVRRWLEQRDRRRRCSRASVGQTRRWPTS